jgi:hypothetical protein
MGIPRFACFVLALVAVLPAQVTMRVALLSSSRYDNSSVTDQGCKSVACSNPAGCTQENIPGRSSDLALNTD